MAQITIVAPASWQPTVAGALAALGAYFLTLGGYWLIAGQVLNIGGLFILGLTSKQANVTGGTRVQPSTPEAAAALASVAAPNAPTVQP
jgi:hypothetical protein